VGFLPKVCVKWLSKTKYILFLRSSGASPAQASDPDSTAGCLPPVTRARRDFTALELLALSLDGVRGTVHEKIITL
jgi:hypothetical protein